MDERTAAQIIALTVVIKALVATHPNHEAIRKEIEQIMKDGFKEEVDAGMESLIDRSVLNWVNGLRKVKK
jgi:hypothetical protein